MSETVTKARELIQSRLDEVAGEAESLSSALEALGSNGSTAAPVRRRRRRSAPVVDEPGWTDETTGETQPDEETAKPKRRGRPKGKRSRGNKADQVKALAVLAAENPGASNADIAEALNVGASTAAVLLSKFKKEGLAERKDGVLRVGKVSAPKRKSAKRGKAKAAKKAPAKKGKAKAKRTRKAAPKDDVADAIEMLDI